MAVDMIKPNFITFTGIDARTDIARVESLSKKYPVEWGVLFSEVNTGHSARYPSFQNLERLFQSHMINNGLYLSAHICGKYSRDILQYGYAIPIEGYLRGKFQRTQINIHDGETRVDGEIRSVRAQDFAHFIAAKKAIIQCRARFPDDPAVDWLYDLSGGTGVVPSSWNAEAGKSEAFCGYAGGIGPDNVLEILTKIGHTHPHDKEFWIDMEWNVRTNDFLDLDKCESVLKQVYG